MKFKITLAFIFIWAFGNQSFCQNVAAENITVKGVVLDKETNTALAYVSVGVLNKPEGTVCDSIGRFSFKITQENLADTLQISLVGYGNIRISVKDFMATNDKTIKLKAEVKELAEVTVISSTPRIDSEVIGRQKSGKLVQLSVHNKTSVEETIGSEMGMRYHANKRNAILKDFNFYISANNFNFIKFRINIYSLKNNMPDTIICKTQIFATINDFKTGWTKIDLEQYNIKINGEFIITMQWIESRMAKKENPITIVPVAVTAFSKNCYTRVASQDKWKRMGVTLSNFITIAY